MNTDSRKVVIFVMFVLVGLIYAGRLFYMQVVDDKWQERAAVISQKKLEIKPPRGVIYDRNRKKIVRNKTYYDLRFIPQDIDELDTVAFGKMLGMSRIEVRERFQEIITEEDRYIRSKSTGKRDSLVNDYRGYYSYAFVSELTNDEMALIIPDLGQFKGFYEEITSMRDYPYPNGANIFGYLAPITPKEYAADDFYAKQDVVGRSGIEKYYEKVLRGQKGIKYILKSAVETQVDKYADGKFDTLAKQGDPLHLGLDIDLQAYGEELMQNKLGCIVAIEPSTGEILSMVSAPSYNPNLMVGRRKTKKNYNVLLVDSLRPLYPRPLQAEYPPGSILKLVQAAVGLQEEVITENTGFPCTKSMVGCHNHPNASTIQSAIQYSCNPYFYYEVRRIIQQGKNKSVFKDAAIGQEMWVDYMHSFGLGVRPETDISGLRSGVIPDVAYYNRWYGENRWAFSTIRSNSIGQGEVSLTPLQMANLAAIMANRGYYYPPHFVSSIGNKGPLEKYKKKNYTKVDAKHFDPIVEGMRRVVNEPGGTARRARISDIEVCGKTGTAQNPHGEDHSVFIAFAPKDNPKIAIAVFVENAGFGGTWAAPIASLMIEKYINGEVKDERKETRILEGNLINP